jgi:hypothetical protein
MRALQLDLESERRRQTSLQTAFQTEIVNEIRQRQLLEATVRELQNKLASAGQTGAASEQYVLYALYVLYVLYALYVL